MQFTDHSRLYKRLNLTGHFNIQKENGRERSPTFEKPSQNYVYLRTVIQPFVQTYFTTDTY